MADIRTLTGIPDVLVVTGRELRHDSYRSDLRSVLYAADATTSAVRRGTHHFWITWFVPTTVGGEYDDGDPDARPARLRGVIRMGGAPADTTAGSWPRRREPFWCWPGSSGWPVSPPRDSPRGC